MVKKIHVEAYDRRPPGRKEKTSSVEKVAALADKHLKKAATDADERLKKAATDADKRLNRAATDTDKRL